MSSFRAYMAGIGTVVVTLVLGFGGGMMIAERFGSTTAVKEQYRTARDPQTAGASNKEEPAAKPVRTEKILTGNSLTPTPQTFAPSPQAVPSSPATASQPAPSQADAPPTDAQQQTAAPQTSPGPQAAPRADELRRGAEPRQREAIRELAPDSSQRQQFAPAEPGRADSAFSRRRAARSGTGPDPRQTVRQDSRRAAQDTDQRSVETDGVGSRDDADEPRFSTPRKRGSESRRVTREAIDESEDEVIERVEVEPGYRRRSLPGPFFGFFGR